MAGHANESVGAAAVRGHSLGPGWVFMGIAWGSLEPTAHTPTVLQYCLECVLRQYLCERVRAVVCIYLHWCTSSCGAPSGTTLRPEHVLALVAVVGWEIECRQEAALVGPQES